MSSSPQWYADLLESTRKRGSSPAPEGPQRILVTGTTGWIAGGVAKALAEQGHSVTGIARRRTEIEGVTAMQADLQSMESLAQLGEGDHYDILLHLAGSLGACTVDQAMNINIRGTHNIVAAALKAGCKRIVVASSVAVIGTIAPSHPPPKLPLPVDAPFTGSDWAYAWSKFMVEQTVGFMALRPEYAHADFLVVRVGATVTDPPEIVHFDGIVDGKQVSWKVEPATAAPEPATAETPEIFKEDALMAVAYSDQVECFVHCAVRAPRKPGLRQIACVAPRPYAKDAVPDIIRSWYGKEAASKVDMTWYDDPKHAADPVYDLGPGKELGWEPKVDLLAAKL